MDITNQLKENLKRKSIKDIFALQIAATVNRVISIGASILLARFLGATGYGLYALIFVFTGLICLIDIGYSKVALVLLPEAYAQKNKESILNIFTYLFKINLFIYSPLYLAAIILAPLLTSYLYQNQEVGVLARLVLFSLLLATFSNILNLNLEAQRKMKHLSILENSHIFLRSLLPLAFLFLGYGLSGVIFGYGLAEIIVAIVSLIIYFFWSKKNECLPSIVSLFKNLKQVKLKENLKFSLSIVLDSNLGNFLTNLPGLILSLLVGPATVGFYRLATGYVNLPSLFMSSISRVLNVKFPEDKVRDIALLRKNFYRSSFLAGIAFIILLLPLVLLAPYLIPLFYGAEFKGAVPISYWLIGYLLLSGFSVGFGPIYRLAKKVYLSVIFNILRTLAGLVIFAVFYYALKISPLISVLVFQLFLGLSVPFHFLFIKKLILDKLN